MTKAVRATSAAAGRDPQNDQLGGSINHEDTLSITLDQVFARPERVTSTKEVADRLRNETEHRIALQDRRTEGRELARRLQGQRTDRRQGVLVRSRQEDEQGGQGLFSTVLPAEGWRDGAEAGAGRRDSTLTPHQVFGARAWARACLWQAGEFDLHTALDVLQTGDLDQDEAQGIMSRAFAAVR
jgi:hypothetical protein